MARLSRFFSLPTGQRLAIVSLTALVIEIGFLAGLPARYRVNDNTDYWREYKPVAENILSGRGITGADGNLELRYPPGYSAFLACVFRTADALNLNRDRMIDVFDLLIGAFSSTFVFLIGGFVFGEGTGVLAWFLWITYLPHLWILKEPASEVPFMLFLYAAVWVFCWALFRCSTITGFLVGALLGVAALVRPIALFLPLFFVFASLAYVKFALRRRATFALLVVVGFVLAVAPWEIHVLSKTDKLVMLSTSGTEAMAGGLVFGLTPGPNGERISLPAHLRELMEKAKSESERGEMRTKGAVFRFVAEEAARNPRGVGHLMLIKLYRPWYGLYSNRHEFAIALFQLVYLSLIVFGLVLSYKVFREKVFWVLFLCGLAVYFWGMAFLVVPLLRYMVPPMAFLMLFAAIGVKQVAAKLGLPVKAVF